MNLYALSHEPKSKDAVAVQLDKLHLRFRSAKEDSLTVTLIHGNKFAWKRTRQEVLMTLAAKDEYFSYYETVLVNPDGRHAYYFRITDGTETLYYTEAGILRDFQSALDGTSGEAKQLELDDSLEEAYYFVYPDIAPSNLLLFPAWMQDAMFYQIFVDSFARDEASDCFNASVPWEGSVPWHTCRGGNLRGIQKKLPYLKNLGVNAVYLTPIFSSDSPHKYNTYDYFDIDSGFGTKQDLKELVDTAHSMGIRIILDAVFNHCGIHFAPFEDVRTYGKASRYWNWFFIQGDQIETDPVNYRGFAFGGYMPKLNTGNPETANYLIQAAEFWTKECSLDGWRLDVADELDPEFLRAFRRRIKALNPDACIIGETWHTAVSWLQGDQFDSVMHYPFTKLMTDYFAHSLISAQTFAARLNHLLMSYPESANKVTLNFLDSHDTKRFLSACKEQLFRLKNAAAFLFAYPGMPCIYYGTEVGMDGGPDPDCRRGFPRDEANWNQELLTFFQNLTALRRQHPALRYGSVRIASYNGLVLLLRCTQTERILLVINLTDAPVICMCPELLSPLIEVMPELPSVHFHPIVLSQPESDSQCTLTVSEEFSEKEFPEAEKISLPKQSFQFFYLEATEKKEH